MFSLSLIEHTLALPPALLGLSREKAVMHQLEKLYLDKVIANLGLCISVYDIKSIDGGYIFPSEGAPTYTIKFRLIMFRPFVGEVIDAKLKSFDENGLRLSVGFFDDIHIPSHLMLQPSKFLPDPENGNRCRWVWEYTAEEGDPPQILAVDEIGERIRFRVESINYPPIPLEPPKDSTSGDSKSFAPMVITGSMYVEGLGPDSWWH